MGEFQRELNGKAVRFRVVYLQKRKLELLRKQQNETLASFLKKEFKVTGLPISSELHQLQLSKPELAKLVERLTRDKNRIDSLESEILEQSQCISTLAGELESSELADWLLINFVFNWLLIGYLQICDSLFGFSYLTTNLTIVILFWWFIFHFTLIGNLFE